MAHYLKHVQCYFHTEGLRLQSSHLQNFIQNMFYENKEKEAKNGPLFKTHSMSSSYWRSAASVQSSEKFYTEHVLRK